ncbi:MAG: hypothetical protein KDK36_17135 [Leptospiraceae bacterium]|nr:hypothetical protein [Leptospiraceae bacterium]
MKRSPYFLIDSIFSFQGKSRIKLSVLFLLVFLFPAFLFAQDKKEPAPAKKAEPAAKSEPSSNTESKPLKMEEGTVTVDPKLVSKIIKQTNIKHLKKLKSTFINNGEEQKFNDLMKGYVEATITLGEKNYLEARRKFEQNQSDMNEAAKGFTEKYKETYNKLYSDYSFAVVEMKINGTTDISNSSYEKMLATGNELKNNAEESIAKGEFIDAVYSMKSAILQLIKVPYLMNKKKNKDLKINERLEKNLIIDEDFIPQEILKDYDDCLFLIHEERQKDRDKERETVKKGIENRLGIVGTPNETVGEAKEKKEKPPETTPAAKEPEKK